MRIGHESWLRLGDARLALGSRPLLMGIVNVTPDSFSDGGRFFDPSRAVEHALRLVDEGADWLDIGGESTRPGAEPVPAEEELRRVRGVIETVARNVTTPISIDTYKPAVARPALDWGARIINDVTGFREPEMIALAARTGATCICMHMRGTPQTMAGMAEYGDVMGEVGEYFEDRLGAMTAGGIDPERIVLDPGIGFAKKLRHNVEIIRRLGELHRFGRPVMLGASRKRIIGELTGRAERSREAGTIGSTVMGYLRGADILRVHDVAGARDALAVAAAIAASEPTWDNGVSVS